MPPLNPIASVFVKDLQEERIDVIQRPAGQVREEHAEQEELDDAYIRTQLKAALGQAKISNKNQWIIAKQRSRDERVLEKSDYWVECHGQHTS